MTLFTILCLLLRYILYLLLVRYELSIIALKLLRDMTEAAFTQCRNVLFFSSLVEKVVQGSLTNHSFLLGARFSFEFSVMVLKI